MRNRVVATEACQVPFIGTCCDGLICGINRERLNFLLGEQRAQARGQPLALIAAATAQLRGGRYAGLC
jgi:hypothetical protein